MDGKRLAALRKEAGLTQKELAEKLQVTPKAVSFYELEQREPSDEALLYLAKLFNTSTDYLLGRTNDRNRPYYELTEKDHKEIDAFVNDLENQMDVGLMLDGEPMDAEAMEQLKENIRFAAEIAKRESKKKFTPKKYRD